MASLGEAAAKKPRRKRQVLTVEDRERNKRKAEDSKWGAAKTYNAKAWINPTRLLKEVFAGEEDVLVLKVGPATRREICFRSESMNLHSEQLNTQSDPDAAADCWVVVGRNRMTVAENVREIQRQSQRSAQLARDREVEENDDDSEDHENGGDEAEEVDNELILDPRLAGEYSQQEINAKPAVPEQHSQDEKPADEARRSQDPDSESTGNVETNDRHNAKPPSDRNSSSQQDEVHGSEANDEPTEDDQHEPRETEEKAEHEPAAIEETHDDHSKVDQDRTADWVTQHAAPYRSPSPESLDPTGRWHVTSEGITEKYGQTTDLQLSIYITPTLPQNDNDTDDGLSAPLDEQNTADDDVDDADLTPEQRRRKGTYQMWATFTFGLYHGIMRFLPSTAVPTPHKRSIFDLNSHQLPSVANTTFQYKWRGRDTTDEEINIEAENATQWIKFEDDGVGITGMFESDVLGENRFEGKKVGVCEVQGGKLGRLWSQISAQAHEYEKKMGR